MMTKSVGASHPYADENVKLTVRLLKDFQAGDLKAFSRLYDLHVQVMYNYGYRLTPNKELLKDCIHDVFLKVYNKRDEVNSIKNFKLYMLVALKNRIYDEGRKQVNMLNVNIEDVNPLSTDDVEYKVMRLERECAEDRIIEDMIKELTPRQREAIILYYMEEKEYKDICKIMNMNYQSVRNLIYCGLKKLRGAKTAKAFL